MKRIITSIALILGFAIQGYSQLLPANQCESQSPCNARSICGNVVTTNFSYATTPAFNPVGVCGAFTYSSNWMYYRFTCYTTGTLNFRLVPIDSTLVGSDLDWALWNITTSGCGSLTAGNLVSCNAAGAGPVVGATTFSATGILTGGIPAANFQPGLPVVAGSTYILGISNPGGASTGGFNLNFGLSTTSIADNKKPYMASVIPFDPCSPVSVLKIKLSEPVRCDQLVSSSTATVPVPDYTFSSAVPAWTAAGQGCSGCVNVAPNANPNYYGNATDTLAITFASALTPGTYTISVATNAWFDLCSKADSNVTLTFTVPAPFAINIHTGFDCDTLKYIDTVYGTNGLSPYQYKAVGGGLAASYGVFGTATPSYTIYKVAGGTPVTYTVKDAGGCLVDSILNRPSVLALGAPNLSASSGPPCHDQFALDSITVISQSGGVGPYTFTLAPVFPWTFTAPNKWKNIVFPGLGATFTVTVTDGHGCTKAGVKNMVNPSVVNLSAPTATNPVCFGDSTGKLCFNSATGGTPLYTYSINPTYPNVTLTTTPNNCFNNLPAGTYTITVTDANGCTATSTKLLSQPSVVSFSAASLITQPTCPNNCDGKYKPVGLGGSGGKKFYKYPYIGPGPWDYSDSVVVTAGPTSTFNNLCPGTYTIIAKDALGCTATTVIVLDHPPYPFLNVGPISAVPCFGGTGSIPVNVTVGTGSQYPPTAYTVANYTYMPSPVTGMAVSVPAAGGGMNATYTGVPAGTYDLIVTNNNGCADTVFGVVMTEPLAPLSIASVVVDSVLCFGSATGAITVQATGGTTGVNAYQYAIKSGAGPFSAYSAPTLAPYVFSSLAANTYTIRARDQNNCTIDRVETVDQPTKLNLLLDDVDATCFGTSDGEICVVDTGGTADYKYKLGVAGIYSSFQPAGSPYCFSNLAAGNYSVYTIDSKGCLDTLAVNVASIPLPIVSFTASPNDTVCDGTAVTLSGTGADVYVWAGVPAITDGNPFTPSLGMTQYIVTGTNNSTGCKNKDTAFVLVNPIPVLTDPNDQVVCNNTSTTAVNFTSNVLGTTYTWTHDATAAIGIGTSGSGTIPSFTAVNAGNTPLIVTFTVTPTGPAITNCVGADQTFTITINPTPILTDPADQVLCAGDFTADVFFASTVLGSTFSWINSNNTTGIPTFSGNGDILTFMGLNTTNLPNVSNITVTPSANGCPGANQSFSITVNPIPVVTDPADQVLCNGSSTTAVNFLSTVTGTTFSWTNTDPSIGLLGSGTGNIPSFTAVNTGNTPVTAVITVTGYGPNPTNCMGVSQTFSITVNPTPIIVATADETICANTATTAIVFGNSVSGATFTWTNSNPSIGLAANSGGPVAGIPSFTGTNVSSVPQTGTIIVTPSANGCPGVKDTFTITVDPLPVLTAIPNQTVCDNESTSAINFASTVLGTTYAWSYSASSNIGLPLSGTSNIAAFTAVNIGTVPVVATFTVTPTGPAASNCVGANQTFTITVLPRMNPNFTYSSSTYCQTGLDPLPIFAPGANTGGTFSATPAGLVINSASGLIDLSASILNTYTVKYVTLGPCPDSATFNVTITLAPSAVFSYPSLSYCQNGIDPLPTFQLVPPASAGFFSATPAGLTINSSTGEVTAATSAAGTYTVKNFIAAAGGCDSAVATTTLIIDSTTILTQPANQVLCNGANTTLVHFTSTVPGTTYSWVNNNTSIGLAATGNGDIPSFTAVNTGITPQVATISVTPVGPTPNFCDGLPLDFTITVNPDAKIALTSAVGTNAQTLCIGATLTDIEYTITGGGTSATGNGFPGGVTGLYSAGVYTISGSPTGPAGVYTYTVTTTGSCAQTSATGTITVSPDATLALTSPVGTNTQTVCINSPIVNITYAVGGTGTASTVTGLPTGVSASGTTNITISGSPSVSGSFTYTVTATGTCGSTTTTGTINVTPLQIPGFTYATSSYCQTGTDPSPIFGATTTLGGTFSATPIGLSINATTGVIDLSLSSLNTYTVTYVTPGPCPDSATFSVTITTAPCATFAYGTTNYCQTAADPTPTFTIGCSAGVFSALPAGLSINTTTGQIDVSLSNAGVYTVTNFIAAAGGCAPATATTVVTIDSSTVMNDPADMSVCVGVATSAVIFNGAVAGSSYNWTNSNTAIGLGASGAGNLPSFIPTNAGSTAITATITVTPTGPAPSSCLGVAQTFTITVNPNAIITLTSAAATASQSPCVNTAITNIVYTISGTGNNATIAWSPSTPTGITGTYVAGVYTISGTPTVTGTFTYTVTATGTCGSATATGTCIVKQDATVTLTSAAATCNQTVCKNSPITTITYVVGGTGTGSTVTGLPAGVNATGTTNISISGSPTVVGTYTYTVTATGTCGSATTTCVIIVDPLQDPTFSYPSSTICNTGSACPNAPNTPGGVFSVTPALSAAQFNTTTGCFTLPVTVGAYTVKYVTPGPCKDSMTVNVNITTAPCTQFSYPNASYCQSSPNPSPTYSTGCSAGAFTYTPAGLSINASNGTINLLGSSAGTYTVTNTIAASGTCPASTSTFVVTIVSKPVFTFVSSTPAGCNPNCNGTVTSTITGGTGTYTCTISPATGTVNNTGFASNLCAGTVYTITATDGIGCSGTTTVSVTTAPSPSITLTAFTNTTVLGTPDGTATTSTTGGTGAYTYTVVGPGTINAVGYASGLSGDTACVPHLITVTDAVGCTDTVTACIGAPGLLMCVPTHTNVTCHGGNNGTLKDSVYGGTSPYTFVSLNGSSGAVAYSPGTPVNVITASGLTADTYTATWKDSNNVSCTNIIIITEPTLLSFNLPVIGKPSCNPGCDGTISISATGGTAAYTYSIATPAGVTCVATQTTPGNFGGIGVGTYTITATDAHLCTATIAIAVAQSPTPTITISHTNPSCHNVCDGTATAVALAGTPAYTYAITSPAGTTCVPTQSAPTSGNFTTLGGGVYTIVVTDSKGCTNSDTETVVDPGAITIDSVITTNPSCNLSCNGTIHVYAVGGTGALGYTLTKPVGAPVTNATGIFNSLCAGTYTVSAHDANCNITATVVITDPPALSWSVATSTNISCAGSANGSISTTATGGTGIIEYSKNGATYFPSGNFSLLLAGTYTITAKDANGCTLTTSFTIVEPPVLTLSAPVVTDVTCAGANDGTITTVAGGGTPGYTYSIAPGGATQTTPGNFTGVGPGTYVITVTDNAGCTKTANGITVTQPTPLTFTLTNHQDVACFGGNTGSITVNTQGGTPAITYSLLPNTGTQAPAGFFSGLTAGTYTVIATDAHNCIATVSVTLTQGPQIIMTNSTAREPVCHGDANGSISFTVIGGTGQLKYQLNGGPFQTDTVFSNLVAGNYILTVVDALGCSDDFPIDVKEPAAVGAIINLQDANCVDSKDGKALITGTGGRGGYKYYLTPGLHINKSGIFTGLEPGNYLLRVVDTSGCEYRTNITINPPANPLANVISKHDLSCNGVGNEGNATANVAGGTPPYTYLWSTNPPQTTPEASTLYYGYYNVTVTDANGCVVKDTVYIEEGPCCEIAFIPNAFSPNGDQLNDEFRVLTTAGVILLQLEIYDRWGKRIWSTIDYRRGWDGMIDGHDAANDTYYYIFRYTCTRDNKTYTKKGDLILIR